MTDIVDTAHLSEGFSEEEGFSEDLAATAESRPEERIEFHVQMRGYTAREMDQLIVEAAARVIVGRSGATSLAKQIEDRCIALTAQKVDARLETVTAEIVNQPIIHASGSTKEPVTMADFLSLYGREYLTQLVDRDGKPTDGGYYSRGEPRIQQLVAKAMDRKFKDAIEAATSAAIREVQTAIQARHTEMLTAEKARIREALAKVTA